VGTQFTIRGLIFLWTAVQPISVFGQESFAWLGNGRILGVPVPVVVMLAVFLVCGFIMRATRFGARVYAIGGSEKASRLAGIRVGRIRTQVYVLSAVSAGLAGLLLASINGSAYSTVAIGSELSILGAVILGGTSLAGGRGSVLGTLLGVLLLGVLANGLNILGAMVEVQTFVQGLVLIIAVTFDEIRRRLRESA
jgi:ribose/xylose/arabinose/galactoside ABC-type transport system permease subunit